MGIPFNHINQMDDIKFTMQSSDSEGSIPFLGTNCSPYSKHSVSAKRPVIQALTHRTKMVCSIPELLAKEMDFLHKVLCRNSYPDWFLKKPNTRPQMAQASAQENKKAFVLVPNIQGLSKEFRRIFKDTKVQIIFKGCNTLKSC